jgi:HK97 family phage portal protein
MKLFGSSNDLVGLELRSDPLEDPGNPLSSPALWQWLTGGEPTASGETVNENNALQISTVYRCVRFIGESIASLPLEVWEQIDEGREKAVDHDLFYLMTLEPNPEMSAFTYKENQFGCLALTGNCYAEIERNKWRDPVALWPLHPHKTKPVRIENELMYQTTDGMAGGATRLIAPANVLHVPLFSFDGILGLSPIGLMRQSLGLAKATEKFGARYFGNGSKPGGVITNKGPKPDPKARKEMVDSWNQEQGGVNQGKTAFLFGGEWDYKQIGLSPEDSQFLATRQYQRADIASIFGLPPHYAGDTSRMSGNNAEQESLRVVTDTFRPYMARFENEYDRKLMPRQGRKANLFSISFDVSARLRGDFKTQQEGFAAGVQWGWYSPNDVRKKLGENRGPKELDVYRLPVNMENAKVLLEDPEPVPGPGMPAALPGPGAPAALPPTDPAADPAAAPAGPADVPTPAEKKQLGMYARAYAGLYRRGFRQLYRRDKRDSRAIRSTIGPVLDAAAQLALETFHAPAEQLEQLTAGLVDPLIEGLEKRAAKWPAALADIAIDELAGPEFLRAVRSVHINAAKNTSAAAAAAEVTA